MSAATSDRTTESPRDAYARRRDARQAEVTRLGRVDNVVAGARFAVFVAAVVIGALAFKGHHLSGLWLLAPAGTFLGLIVLHARVIGRREQAERAVRLYDEGIARVEDRASR